MVKSAKAVLQQDERQEVADLVKVHLGHHHVDGVGEGKDGGEEVQGQDWRPEDVQVSEEDCQRSGADEDGRDQLCL